MQRTRRKQSRLRGGNVKFDIFFRQPSGRQIFVDGQYLTKDQTRAAPEIDFVHDDDWTAFVVIMYDKDAPVPARIHWLYSVLDHSAIDYFKYQPPNPPPGEIHTYTIELLSKPYDGRGLLGIIPEPPPERANFDVEDFKELNGLALEARKTFKSG